MDERPVLTSKASLLRSHPPEAWTWTMQILRSDGRTQSTTTVRGGGLKKLHGQQLRANPANVAKMVAQQLM
jgi:hypothetical protein